MTTAKYKFGTFDLKNKLNSDKKIYMTFPCKHNILSRRNCNQTCWRSGTFNKVHNGELRNYSRSIQIRTDSSSRVIIYK